MLSEWSSGHDGGDERARRDDRYRGGGAAPHARARPRAGGGGGSRAPSGSGWSGPGPASTPPGSARRCSPTAGLDARPARRPGSSRRRRGSGAGRGRRHHPHRRDDLGAAARELAIAAGARVVAITGEGKGWPEAIEAAPPERSETYTASYLAALLVLARLAVALGGAEWDDADLAALPSLVEAAGAEPLLVERPPRRLTVLCGAGPAAITAREGALKLREAARLLAEGFESEYLLHGSAVPLDADDLLIAIDPAGDPTGLTAGLLRAAEQEGLTVATLDPPADLHPLLAQLPMTVRLQFLASRWADSRHLDPDRVILGGWADETLWR